MNVPPWSRAGVQLPQLLFEKFTPAQAVEPRGGAREGADPQIDTADQVGAARLC